jgi:hypothetical protein
VPPAPRPDATRRDWLSFEHDDDSYVFDVSFLLSPWRCIFGAGCRGVLDHDASDLGHGCCSHGAYFADKADRTRVRAAAAKLTAEQWQFRRAGRRDGTIARNDDGDWTTRVHDGACVFLNRPDFERGAGCALHVAALDAGERPMDWKPEVCWQLPLRLTHQVDEVGHTTWTLREWMRRDWGGGGAEFHWWCTETDDAFIDPDPVVVTLADEIIGLVGEQVHQRLCDELGIDPDRRAGTGPGVAGGTPAETWLPHPTLRSDR